MDRFYNSQKNWMKNSSSAFYNWLKFRMLIKVNMRILNLTLELYGINTKLF